MNDPAGVSIDNLCRPSSSPRAIAAGCTGSDGAALTDSSTACGMCSGGFFLFRGGCYSTESTSGSEICTAAEGGRCTACNAANGLFKNPATAVTLSNECILCSDATGANGVTGVANCQTYTAPGSAGVATCSECQEGYYLNDQGACTQCDTSCATCSGTGQNACTSCPEGKYLKSDKSCSDACESNQYADKQSGQCKACSEIAGCNTCKYNATVSKPQCTACTSQKMIKTEVDGTTTCVDAAGCATDNKAGSHFKTDDNKCLLCSDDKTGATTPANKGIANCKTCTKSGAPPQCSACLDGYFYDSSQKTCTQQCGTNCATCSEANNANKCSTCMTGFFLVTEDANKKCVPCGDTAQDGIDGCAECDNQSGTLKCTKCKPNRKPKGESGNYTCEEKTCEDDSACGGTAGPAGRSSWAAMGI